MNGPENTTNRLKKIRKTALILAATFLVIFLLRWAYEVYFSRNEVYVTYDSYANANVASYELDLEGKGSRFSGNVASAKVKQTDVSGNPVTIDQKYEKTAAISASTDKFEAEKQKLGGYIEESNAVIQAENTTGLSGSQLLYLEIGVSPDNFDGLVEQLKGMERLDSFSVQKVDRTSQYKMLMAEIETLETTRDSYMSIKEKAKTINEMLSLEEKILEVEGELQNMGVDLGVFSTENSFCTIKFSLKEAAGRSISVRYVFSCGKDSIVWTFQLFVIVGLAVLLLLGILAVILVVLSYLKKNVSRQSDGEKLIPPPAYDPYIKPSTTGTDQAPAEPKDTKVPDQKD